MNVLKRSLISEVSQLCFSITCITALLANASASLGQSNSTNFKASGRVEQSNVPRLEVTLGSNVWLDGGPLRRNLVVNNPGFEPADYREILRCGAVTADGCRIADAATVERDGFWNGAHYQVMSGGAEGATGTVVSHTSGGDGSALAFDKSLNLSPGDYLSVEVQWPKSGIAGWSSSANVGGAVAAESEDLSPETAGKQAVLLSALGHGEAVRLSQEVDARSGLGTFHLNGAYEVSFRAKGVGGNNRLNVSVGREASGNAPYLNRPVMLTDSWAQYTLSFSAVETAIQSSPLQLDFAAAGANIEVDDVSLQQSNSDSANPTAFRDEVLDALKELHPGTIRTVSGSSDVLTQLADPFARYTPNLRSDVTSAAGTAYGIQEFLELCATVGADPWITVAASTTPLEMTELVQYLTGGGADSWSALRISRGQAEPWTSVFNKVHIELENGTGIGGSPSEPIASPAYVSWSNAVFGAARRSTGYSASKFDLILAGSRAIPPMLPTPASSLTAETLTTQSATTPVQAINCSSGFASSGACGVSVDGYSTNSFIVTHSPTAVLAGSQVNMIVAGSTHFGSGLIYQTPVNVQAFTTTFTFVPNGWNFAFVLQNNTNADASPAGRLFAAGAGCEAGFYQAFDANSTPPNNIFALELDQQSPLANTNGLYLPFTYSSVQVYQAGQSPCNPNDGQPNYYFTPKISTSPVPLNSPVNSQGTTTGDRYSVTLSYNGSTLNMSMYNVTAGGSCPSSNCFTQSWSVNIPALVGGTTAYLGFTGGTNTVSIYPLYVSSLVYSPVSSAGSSSPNITGQSANYGGPYANITLTGSNFGATQGSSTVTFSGVRAPVLSWSNTSIKASVPLHATTGNVVVTVAGQTSNGIAFTVEPPLSVTGISPSSGPVGTTVTITGENLVDAEGRGTVYFSGKSLPILNPTNTSIRVVIPAGATSGVFDVHINGVGIYSPTFNVN